MIKFDLNVVLKLQDLIIDRSGGDRGVRDFNLLDSALANPFQTFMGKELYKTVEEKGARLGFNLISNHAFLDGNKRIGILVMLTFLEVNGVELDFTEDELISLGWGMADGKFDCDYLYEWIISHKKMQN